MRSRKEKVLEEINSDENFYFIVGYTEGGFLYGITWEEALKDGLIDKNYMEIEEGSFESIPF